MQNTNEEEHQVMCLQTRG